MDIKQLTIEPHVFRDQPGFRVYERGGGGWGTSAFLKTLEGAKLFAIGVLEGHEGAKDRAMFAEGKPHFTLCDFDALIANAEKCGLIKYRGVRK